MHKAAQSLGRVIQLSIIQKQPFLMWCLQLGFPCDLLSISARLNGLQCVLGHRQKSQGAILTLVQGGSKEHLVLGVLKGVLNWIEKNVM